MYRPGKQGIYQNKTSLQWGQKKRKLEHPCAGMGLKAVQLFSLENLIKEKQI